MRAEPCPAVRPSGQPPPPPNVSPPGLRTVSSPSKPSPHPGGVEHTNRRGVLLSPGAAIYVPRFVESAFDISYFPAICRINVTHTTYTRSLNEIYMCSILYTYQTSACFEFPRVEKLSRVWGTRIVSSLTRMPCLPVGAVRMTFTDMCCPLLRAAPPSAPPPPPPLTPCRGMHRHLPLVWTAQRGAWESSGGSRRFGAWLGGAGEVSGVSSDAIDPRGSCRAPRDVTASPSGTGSTGSMSWSRTCQPRL